MHIDLFLYLRVGTFVSVATLVYISRNFSFIPRLLYFHLSYLVL